MLLRIHISRQLYSLLNYCPFIFVMTLSLFFFFYYYVSCWLCFTTNFALRPSSTFLGHCVFWRKTNILPIIGSSRKKKPKIQPKPTKYKCGMQSITINNETKQQPNTKPTSKKATRMKIVWEKKWRVKLEKTHKAISALILPFLLIFPPH